MKTKKTIGSIPSDARYYIDSNGGVKTLNYRSITDLCRCMNDCKCPTDLMTAEEVIDYINEQYPFEYNEEVIIAWLIDKVYCSWANFLKHSKPYREWENENSLERMAERDEFNEVEDE